MEVYQGGGAGNGAKASNTKAAFTQPQGTDLPF